VCVASLPDCLISSCGVGIGFALSNWRQMCRSIISVVSATFSEGVRALLFYQYELFSYSARGRSEIRSRILRNDRIRLTGNTYDLPRRNLGLGSVGKRKCRYSVGLKDSGHIVYFVSSFKTRYLHFYFSNPMQVHHLSCEFVAKLHFMVASRSPTPCRPYRIMTKGLSHEAVWST
jgi:hypothetical protein